MSTSPPNENNWDDEKGSEIPVSSEQSALPPSAPSEDHPHTTLDPSNDQEEDISSHQPILSADQDEQGTSTKEVELNQETFSETPTLANKDLEDTLETPPPTNDASEALISANDDPETLILTNDTLEAPIPANDNPKVQDAKDKIATPSTEALVPGQTALGAKPPTSKKKSLPRGVKILLLVLAILVFLGATTAGLGYYYYAVNIKKPLAQIYRPVKRTKLESTPQATATSQPQPTYDVIKGRSWNILLLGSDNDGKYTFPNILTQVMMIVHVDTVKNTVSMVSIPRDSWVSLPGGYGTHKIDQAFSIGEQQTGKFEDGVTLARETVEADYGVTIDRYAWVGLDGFSKVIDTLGGVDIDVEHPIVDDDYPNDVGNTSNAHDTNAYKRLYIATGPQHLNGQEALEYVRSRHSDLVGDIGRTQRQQQVLEALKLKLNATTIIANFSQLLKDVSGNIYSDLDESEMLAFANYGRTLPNDSIQHITLGIGTGDQNYGSLETIYDESIGANQDVVIPNCTTIQPEINKIFQLGNAQSCNVIGY